MRTRGIGPALIGLLVGLTGCGKEVPTPGETADVTGTLTQGGKPLGNLLIKFQPTGGTAQPAQVKTDAGGAFRARMVAGSYSWYLVIPEAGSEEGADVKKAEARKLANALKAVPAAYREASLDRQIEVESGAKLDLVIN